MPYNEELAGRVQSAMARVPRVTQKKMFGGLAFMVNGKLCVTVGRNRVMVRIDPEVHEFLLRRKGTKTVTMGGRKYPGYIRVAQVSLKTRSQLEFWVKLALDFNKRAGSSRFRR